ncbi:MAG: HAD hydrolase family protein [Selenomonadaceae bacterium]|nr:HAD hydrolase family protein [Selenomonadaceae bacterium]
MKIAASDYDGTLFREERISAEDVEGVRQWRAKGNRFGVVTGRDYGMLAPQLHHYGIGFDYVVSNNGGLICRADGTPLWQGTIPLDALAAMVKDPGVRRSFHFAFSAVDCTYLYHEREGSWIAREAGQWEFQIVKIREPDIPWLPQIHQFSLGYPEPEEAAAVSASINAQFGEIVHAYPNRCSLDITPKGISKRQGIEKLVELMGWESPEIYAIGDETNDLPMLEAFQGFTVETAREDIRKKARKVYSSVGSMLIDCL